MRAVSRVDLPDSTQRTLTDLSKSVGESEDPKSTAAALWRGKPKETFDTVRSRLRQMAGGRERCMYCEDNEGTDIEHFWPKATFPERTFTWSNYLLACSHCNSNLKRTRFPMTDREPDLLDPSDPDDDPVRHLFMIPSNGRFHAIGPKGKPSIDVFDLNGDVRGRKLPQGRKDTLLKLQLLVLEYDRLARDDRHTIATDARAVKEAILREPFPAVLRFLVELAGRENGRVVLRAGVAEAIERHQVARW